MAIITQKERQRRRKKQARGEETKGTRTSRRRRKGPGLDTSRETAAERAERKARLDKKRRAKAERAAERAAREAGTGRSTRQTTPGGAGFTGERSTSLVNGPTVNSGRDAGTIRPGRKGQTDPIPDAARTVRAEGEGNILPGPDQAPPPPPQPGVFPGATKFLADFIESGGRNAEQAFSSIIHETREFFRNLRAPRASEVAGVLADVTQQALSGQVRGVDTALQNIIEGRGFDVSAFLPPGFPRPPGGVMLNLAPDPNNPALGPVFTVTAFGQTFGAPSAEGEGNILPGPGQQPGQPPQPAEGEGNILPGPGQQPQQPGQPQRPGGQPAPSGPQSTPSVPGPTLTDQFDEFERPVGRILEFEGDPTTSLQAFGRLAQDVSNALNDLSVRLGQADLTNPESVRKVQGLMAELRREIGDANLSFGGTIPGVTWDGSTYVPDGSVTEVGPNMEAYLNTLGTLRREIARAERFMNGPVAEFVANAQNFQQELALARAAEERAVTDKSLSDLREAQALAEKAQAALFEQQAKLLPLQIMSQLMGDPFAMAMAQRTGFLKTLEGAFGAKMPGFAQDAGNNPNISGDRVPTFEEMRSMSNIDLLVWKTEWFKQNPGLTDEDWNKAIREATLSRLPGQAVTPSRSFTVL